MFTTLWLLSSFLNKLAIVFFHLWPFACKVHRLIKFSFKYQLHAVTIWLCTYDSRSFTWLGFQSEMWNVLDVWSNGTGWLIVPAWYDILLIWKTFKLMNEDLSHCKIRRIEKKSKKKGYNSITTACTASKWTISCWLLLASDLAIILFLFICA